jgi:peptide-methionine (S)-S-oxide reductase
MVAVLSSMLLFHAARCAAAETSSAENNTKAAAGRAEQATFGLGCFWCSEAVFEQLQGVASVEPGYSGGSLKDASYHEVSSGRSGHAEVVQITYDPKVVS